jgi:Arc/MetJ-type ribon-helix-helix transcriptional regulator
MPVYCENNRLARLPHLSYVRHVKTLTIRLPDSLVTEIEHESQSRRVSKSDVVRERLRQPQRAARTGGSMSDLAGDLIGSVRGLPADLSSNKKKYLPELIRAKKLHRR